MSDFYYYINPDDLTHHGIKGMKWGVRRYQNPDGTLTAKGRKHYGYDKADKMNERAQHYKNQASKYRSVKSWKEYMDLDVDDDDAKKLKEFQDEYKRMYKRGGHINVANSRDSTAKSYQGKASELTAKAQVKYDKDRKKVYDKALKKNYVKAYNQAAEYANAVLIPEINKKYSKIIKTDEWSKDKYFEKYVSEYETRFNDVLSKKLEDLIGKNPYEKKK